MNTRRTGRRVRRCLLAVGVTLALAMAVEAGSAEAATTPCRPTVVLVHGAWANGSSWDGVARILRKQGYTVDIAPNGLRGLSADAAQLRDYLAGVRGPIVLVGHSYGGAVISAAATGNLNVKALVYDDAYIPAEGETVAALSGADSALAGAATDPTSVFRLVPYDGAPEGIYDTYLLPKVVSADFAPDLTVAQQDHLAKTQPPTSLLALGEPAPAPAWTTVPSWDIVGRQDRIIPAAAQLAMAKRAGSAVTEIDSSHVSLLSHPDAVAAVITKADRAVGAEQR